MGEGGLEHWDVRDTSVLTSEWDIVPLGYLAGTCRA